MASKWLGLGMHGITLTLHLWAARWARQRRRAVNCSTYTAGAVRDFGRRLA